MYCHGQKAILIRNFRISHVIWYSETSHGTQPHQATLPHVRLHQLVSVHISLCHAMSAYVTPCQVISCHVSPGSEKFSHSLVLLWWNFSTAWTELEYQFVKKAKFVLTFCLTLQTVELLTDLDKT